MSDKIVLFIHSLGGGGAERVCSTLANGFVARGEKVDVLVLNGQGTVFDTKLKPDVNLVDLNCTRTRFAISQIVDYIRREKPAHILSFSDHITLMLILIRLIYRFPVRIIARNISTLSVKHRNHPSRLRGAVLELLTKLLYRKADAIIAQSEGMKTDLIENYGIKPEQVTLIYNPVNQEIERFVAAHDVSAFERDDYILCVGRLEAVKAFDKAIRAFACLKDEFPTLRLKILGQGSEENALKQLCEQLGVNERVDFEGFSHETIPYYLHAKATVLTSLYEGFPNVLVESISLGTPVVAFDCQSGPREIITDGINGYLVKYQDVDDLYRLLYKTLAVEWDRQSVAKTAMRYRSEPILQRYLAVLRKKNDA